MKQKMVKAQREIEKSTIVVGNFKIPFLINNRKSGQ